MKSKNGISLIVLVITIIVMVVLAGAIILTLNNSGIIGKASAAVEETNLKQVQELAQLGWAEAYIDAKNKMDIDVLKKGVEDILSKNNINKDDYDIEVTTEGVTVDIKDPMKALHHSGIIPEGGTYVTGILWDENSYTGDATNAVVYTAGKNFPATPQPLDRYIYGDYTYIYGANFSQEPYSVGIDNAFSPSGEEGWLVTVIDNPNKTEYGTILYSINGKNITAMHSSFWGRPLEVAPLIPPTVEKMGAAFQYTNLKSLPENFEVPASVKDMYSTFGYCSELTGVVKINTTPTDYWGCFAGCDMTKITIIGECQNKDALIATASD